MDLLTQGILGATTAQAGARSNEVRVATFTGFAAGLLPDADALIRSADNPLLTLEYHRHFSHSIFFIPIGALLLATVIWLISKKRWAFSRLWFYALLGISLAGFLDACTSYGTLLLWPILDQRFAWNLLPIIDPVFTLLLLVPLIIGLRRSVPRHARIALCLVLGYLSIAGIQSMRAGELAKELASSRGHEPERMVVKPTLGNILLWRSVYQYNKRIYADAIRPGIFSGNRVYPGESQPWLDIDNTNLVPANSHSFRDLERFSLISEHWLVVHPDETDMVGDARYAMLPDTVRPLWGLKLDLSSPKTLPALVTRRDNDEATRKRFFSMVMGTTD